MNLAENKSMRGILADLSVDVSTTVGGEFLAKNDGVSPDSVLSPAQLCSC